MTQLVRRSPVETAQQQSGVLAARMMTEDSADMMEQDSLDSEEDGLRQLLQQTKYRLFSVLSLSLSLIPGHRPSLLQDPPQASPCQTPFGHI